MAIEKLATHRIGLIHAVAVAVAPVNNAFATMWPEAMVTNLLDDSLSSDLTAAGGQNAAIQDRILNLGNYVRDSGADAVLYTCSAFGMAIDLAKPKLRVPALKPDEAMIDQAFDISRDSNGGTIGVLATFEPALPGTQQQFEERAAQRGIPLHIVMHHVPDAMEALRQGDGERHDALIAAAAREMTGCACLVLAQFSMARARRQVEAVQRAPVLTSPEAAVAKLRQLLGA